MLEPLADGLFGLGVHHEHHSMLIGERATRHHDALSDQGVHERRVLGEARTAHAVARPHSTPGRRGVRS